MCRTFEWSVPARYNLAADTLDKHPRARVAMYCDSGKAEPREISFGELQDAANRIANLLQHLGIKPGDRIAVILPPSPEAAAAFQGIFKVGGILVSLSSLLGDEGLRHRLTDSGARALLTNELDASLVAPLRDELPDLEHVLVFGKALDRLLARTSTNFETPLFEPDHPAQINYSSGTSGPAKGILHAHRYLLGHNDAEFCHDIRGDEVFSTTADWSWIAGIVTGTLTPWRFGAAVAIPERRTPFDPEYFLDFLGRFRVRNMFISPTAIRAMAALGGTHSRYPDTRLRVACCGGEALEAEAIGWFAENMGTEVLDYYGLTESFAVCGNFLTVPVKRGSMGRPIPGWQIAVLDEDDQPTEPGEVGQICLKARSNPHYPLGLWGREDESREMFGGDWFHTQDLARCDEDGHIWYEGRRDDVIISAGYRIGPFEVESAILELDEVVEAAAVASPDRRRGAVVKAFVRLAPDRSPSAELEERIKLHVRERVARYSYPRRVEFVEELPKTISGKIRRNVLRDLERSRTEAN